MSLKGVDDFNWRLRKLNETTTIKPFYSGDEDLDDFLLSDAVAYYKQRLAVTYIYNRNTDKNSRILHIVQRQHTSRC